MDFQKALASQQTVEEQLPGDARSGRNAIDMHVMKREKHFGMSSEVILRRSLCICRNSL